MNESQSFEDNADWISYIFFFHFNSLFSIGYQRSLEIEDLGGISRNDKCSMLFNKFTHYFQKEIKKPKPKRSLWNVLWSAVGYHKPFIAIILFCISAAFQIGPALILNHLVKYFQGAEDLSTAGLWVLVCMLFVFPLVSSLALAHSNTIMSHVGAQVRNTLINAIYRKSLVISPFKRQKISTGRIFTMFSDDTNQIRSFLFFLNNSICAPLQIGACLYLIYQQVGVSTFVGLGYTIFAIPVSGIVFSITAKIRIRKMKKTDARVKLMNEILNGIRIIKYYAWEGAFMKKIDEIRSKEVRLLANMGYLFNAVLALVMVGAPQIQTILIFFTYISLNHQLDSATAFTTLTLFGLMTYPFIFLPFGLQQYNQSLISTKRIMEFLDSDEITPYIESSIEETDGEVIILEQANLGWVPENELEEVPNNQKKHQPLPLDLTDIQVKVTSGEVGINRAKYTLRDIDIRIKKGQLVGIVGTVGSGKSSILNALLGEMILTSGKVKIAGTPKIAYCDQRPWIVNATVKDNILFGMEYNEERFNKAIYAASMTEDIKILPGGVMTEIGERGINISGGQKARVSLARAVYNDADIYMLDDPLSAVDAHVGEHLFKKCIKEALGGKTRLLVTHHLHVLSDCDYIIILESDGLVKIAGTYDEIISSGIDMDKYLGGKKEDLSKTNESSNQVGIESNISNTTTYLKVEKTSSSLEDQQSTEHQSSKKSEKYESGKKVNDGKQLITKEERNVGGVSNDTYWSFISYGGKYLFLLTIACQLCAQAIQIEANFWLADWGKEATNDIDYKNIDMSRGRSFYWLHGYAGMLMASVFLVFSARMLLTVHRTSASSKFHDDLLKKVVYLPVSFFDVTPVGRILNRFTQDMAILDEDLATTLSQMINMGGNCLGAISAIAGSTKGTFLILFVPLAYLYKRFQSYFRASNTAIARLESVSRSPIYADFNQTLAGTSTIRAYSQQARFVNHLEELADSNTVPGVLQQVIGQWLGLRLDFIGALIMFFMGVLAVTSKGNSFIPAGYLALGLSYSISLTALLKSAVRLSSTMEANFNAVERFRHYIVTLKDENDMEKEMYEDETELQMFNKRTLLSTKEPEGDLEMNVISDKKMKMKMITPPPNWPSVGAIEFKDVKMRYRDGPLVLKGVTFDVNSHDKVGIAGRTGCGKSSLMVALFRIENLAGGQIIIDGIDTTAIQVQTLRSKLCIIPQDPVMFSASVRFNLDPFNDFSDEDVWNVLESVNMKDVVLSLPNKLQEQVAEGGDNFSAGQRQLICIARAILRKPKILVMDEATASIDSETDAFIQQMIRTKFTDCTVLTIAHRLHTIVDNTKILILNAGEMMEYDAPSELLAKEGGAFRGLWERHIAEGSAH